MKIVFFILFMLPLHVCCQTISGIKEYKLGGYANRANSNSIDTSLDAKYGYKRIKKTALEERMSYSEFRDVDISHDNVTLRYFDDTLYEIYITFPEKEFIDAIKMKYGEGKTSRSSEYVFTIWSSVKSKATYVNSQRFKDFTLTDLRIKAKIDKLKQLEDNKRAKNIADKI